MPRNLKDIIKEAIGKSLDAYNKKFGKQLNDRIDNIVAQAGTDNTEVVDARMDSSGVKHTTLNNRINEEFKKGKEHLQDVKGQYVVAEGTVPSPIQNIELLGETVQGTNLVDIKSTGIDNGDGTFTYTVVSCGKNMLSSKFKLGNIASDTGKEVSSTVSIASIDFIRVSEGQHIVSINGEAQAFNWFCYDKDFNYLGLITKYNPDFSKERPNTAWVKCSKSITDVNSKVQLELGTVATSYTPYEETRCDIKLPCQLEKWDRLHFDKEENAWVVDKQNNTVFLDANIFKTSNTPVVFDNCIRLGINYVDLGMKPSFTESDVCFTTFGKSLSREEWVTPNSEGVYIGKTALGIVINKSTIGGDTKELMKSYFLSKNHFFKRRVDTTVIEKIVLPQSEQIKLNSFANKTHIYTVCGEVDATVKATVSKSLASTVQANTEEISLINNKIADIEGLKETQDFSYSSDKGYLVCKDTQTGVVKDLKLYGKSLVSKFSKKHTEANITVLYSGILYTTGFETEIGKTYTVLGNVKSPTKNMCDIYYREGNINIGNFKGAPFVFTATNVARLSFVSLETGLYVLDDIMVLEGDYSQNPPQYFEGIGSVGNGKGIEVLSRKEDGNLFNISDFKDYANTFNSQYHQYAIKDNRNCWNPLEYSVFHNGFVYRINFEPKTSYTLKFDYYYETTPSSHGIYFRVVYTDGTFEYPTRGAYNSWGVATLTTNASKTVDYIHMTYTDSKTKTWIDLDSIVIAKTNYYNNNLENQQDKKTILFKNSNNSWNPLNILRGIDEINCDIVDTVKGKYIKKYIEYEFNGNETIDYVTDYGDVSRFSISNIPVYSKLNAKILCDKFNVVTIGTPNIEGINSHATIKNYASIQIKTNKLETKDKEGFKKWLIANPTKMIIELEVPLEYEINPIYPESYDNETMILFGSGAVSPRAEWKITSNIVSFSKNTAERVGRLENEVFSYVNMMFKSMLSGKLDQVAYSLYPTDFEKDVTMTPLEPTQPVGNKLN